MARLLILVVVMAAAAPGCIRSDCPPGATCTSTRTPGPLAASHVKTGESWTIFGYAVGPSPRYMASLAYDGAHMQYVLFGGQTGNGPSDETWIFDGKHWSQRHPNHKPSARRDAAMAWDPTLAVDVLYGGLAADRAEGFETSDTWTWNGQDWTRVIETSTGPGPRQGSRMVSADTGVLLFGGHIANVSYLADVWSFTGAGWIRVDRGSTPPGRGDAAVVWNPQAKELWVYGGTGRNVTGGPGETGIALGDGWLMHNGDWTPILAGGPPPLTLANAFWDETKSRVMLVNGSSCPLKVNPATFAWQWNSSGWRLSPDWFSENAWGMAGAEATNGDILMFGGSDEPGC